MEIISKAILSGIIVLAAVLLYGPYEGYLEGGIALTIFLAVVVGFLIYPKREMFYIRTAIGLRRPHQNRTLEHDMLAVRVELARLWLLFVPTILAVGSLVFLAAGGPTKLSILNWIFSSQFASIPIIFFKYAPLLVLVMLSAWIGERRVLRDAAACSATSFRLSESDSGSGMQVSYAFVGEDEVVYGGDCMFFGLDVSPELGNIVFYNVRKPELNKIAMGLLFHRLVILGRGVTDLDEQTVTAQRAWAHSELLSQPE